MSENVTCREAIASKNSYLSGCRVVSGGFWLAELAKTITNLVKAEVEAETGFFNNILIL